MNDLVGTLVNNRKATLGGALVGGLVVFAVLRGINWFDGGNATRGPARPQKVEIERVISGHSVKLDSGERLNYAGIRTPYKNEPFHEEARLRNQELVEGEKVRVRYDVNDRDRKGRHLAYLSVDGQLINEALVREGLAYVRMPPDTRRFSDRLLAAQADARKHRRGIWSKMPPSSEASYPGDRKYGNFHRPTCEEAGKIKRERLISFGDKGQAFAAGYAPCSKCLP